MQSGKHLKNFNLKRKPKSRLIIFVISILILVIAMLCLNVNIDKILAFFTDSDSIVNEMTIVASYMVTFDSNTGTGTMQDQEISYNVSESLTKNTYIKDGYIFNDWNTDSNGNGTNYADEATMLNVGDVTLYAQWILDSFSITYNLNDGNVAISNPDTYNSKTASFTLNNPVKTGYTFKGWSGTDLTGDENQTVTITQGSIGDREYTANWTINTYRVKFNSNGGTGNMNDMNFTYGIAQALTSNAFEKSGYYFYGWNTKADGTGTRYVNEQEVNNLTTVNNDEIILYAEWFDSSNVTNATVLEIYNCTESVETFIAPYTGMYLLEAWGAQGGNAGETNINEKIMTAVEGGKGGYSSGLVALNAGDKVYVAVGGAGGSLVMADRNTTMEGGYNGGGQALSDSDKNSQGSGGGATHFAINNNLGELKNYSNNQDDILIVAGGGGGSYNSAGIFYYSSGGAGGGENGDNAIVGYNTNYRSTPLTNNGFTYAQGLEIPGASQSQQSTPDTYYYGTFGKGADAIISLSGNDGGAGGGWYGGNKLNKNSGVGGMAGSGGSGHINSLKVILGETIVGSEMIPSKTDSSTTLGNSGDGFARISLVNPE